ncbi:restriction endonuclease subunit S [bacterium]|nr:restriction endonuclease subunit S [bacterium]
MTSNWKECKLSDVCELVAGFAFKSKDFGGYNNKVIKIANITPPYVQMDNLSGVDISQYDKSKLNKFKVTVGDYVLAMTGATIGKLGRILCDEAYINQRVLSFSPKNSIDKKFLYYVLSQNKFNKYILNYTDSDTAQPNISANTIGKYKFYLPELKTQRKIAKVLSAIDDKIELNNSINNNLEQQAMALFKQKIIENCDNKNGTIGDYCSVKSGYAFKGTWWQDCGVKVVKIKTIDNDTINFNDCSYVSEDKVQYAKDFIVQGGDLLIAMTGATIGKFAVIPKINEPLLVNQRVGKFFLGTEPLNRLAFLYCSLKQQDTITEIINRGQGSAQPNISSTDIMTTPCYLPNKYVIDEFNELCKPIFETIITNKYENEQLANLRDALLPKLMSGEIDVDNVEV